MIKEYISASYNTNISPEVLLDYGTNLGNGSTDEVYTSLKSTDLEDI